MANVSQVCQSYFEGFQDVSTCTENSATKNFLGILKIISYLTLIVPLCFGVVYAISSLIGRVSQSDSSNPQDEQIGDIRRNVLGKGIGEQLEDLFKSSKKIQKLFTIDGYKVGVIFNPNGEALKVGFMTVKDGVVLVSDKSLPEEVSNTVVNKIPSTYTHSTLSL